MNIYPPQPAPAKRVIPTVEQIEGFAKDNPDITKEDVARALKKRQAMLIQEWNAKVDERRKARKER